MRSTAFEARVFQFVIDMPAIRLLYQLDAIRGQIAVDLQGVGLCDRKYLGAAENRGLGNSAHSMVPRSAGSLRLGSPDPRSDRRAAMRVLWCESHHRHGSNTVRQGSTPIACPRGR